MSATFEEFLTTLIKRKSCLIDENVALMIRRIYSTEWALSSGYKDTLMFLKAVLFSMHGSTYPSHFGNARKKSDNETIYNIKSYKQN